MITKNNLGLGMCRLSIIDIAGGHQPISNEDGSMWIVYNGEIYNHDELRSRLAAKGHRFRTRSDTEVVLHSFEEYGEECVSHFNGMFAFAIMDIPRRRLFIARDRMGIKPLYYHKSDGIFLFASEIKTILSQPDIKPVLNHGRMAEFMTFRYVAGRETLFKDIFELEPGSFLVLENGCISSRRYWNYQVSEGGEISEAEGMERIEDTLRDSVRYRTMSEVPIGTINSGGIDSSLVSYYLSEIKGAPVETFCVGFDEEEFDERPYARVVADQIRSRHHEITVGSKEFAANLRSLIWYNDEPLNHPNSIPMFLIFRYARQSHGIKVMLSGEGADELFAGYGWYVTASLKERLQPLRPLVQLASLTGHRKIKRLNQILSDTEPLLTVNSVLSDDVVSSIIPDASFDFDDRHRLIPRDPGGNLLSWMLNYDQRGYLVSILQRQDRMSMATSVEARVPFLDHRLVMLANTLPSALKVKGRVTKYILKKVAEKHLPPELVNRKKVGFTIPIGRWFREENGLKPYLELLTDRLAVQRGIFNRPYIERVVDEHLNESKDHGEILWSLINFELWHRMFIDQSHGISGRQEEASSSLSSLRT
jgi:asparagine synthase (glutamine-hydrolysing)